MARIPRPLIWRRFDDYVNFIALLIIFVFVAAVWKGAIPQNTTVVTKIVAYNNETALNEENTCKVSNLALNVLTLFNFQLDVTSANGTVDYLVDIFWSTVTGEQSLCIDQNDPTGALHSCFLLLTDPQLYANANFSQFVDPTTAELKFLFANVPVKPNGDFVIPDNAPGQFAVVPTANPSIPNCPTTSTPEWVQFAPQIALWADSLADVLAYYQKLPTETITETINMEEFYTTLDEVEQSALSGWPCAIPANGTCNNLYNGDMTKAFKAANVDLKMSCVSTETEPTIDYFLRLVAYGALSVFVAIAISLVFHVMERYGVFNPLFRRWGIETQEEESDEELGERHQPETASLLSTNGNAATSLQAPVGTQAVTSTDAPPSAAAQPAAVPPTSAAVVTAPEATAKEDTQSGSGSGSKDASKSGNASGSSTSLSSTTAESKA